MSSLPKISIVVPSYNQGEFLEETLQSIFTQNYPNIELIIMDGGSTDNSVEIIRKYEHAIASWVSKPDKGQTDALIQGFKIATGDIHCWLNADDLWEPNTLFEVAEFFQKHSKYDAVFGNALMVDKHNRLISTRIEHPFCRFISIYLGANILSPAMFWRPEIYTRVGGLNPDYKISLDTDLWLRFANAGGRIGHVKSIWARCRVHKNTKSSRLGKMSKEWDEICERNQHKNKLVRFFCKVIARIMRVIWKTLVGGYGKGYRYLDYDYQLDD